MRCLARALALEPQSQDARTKLERRLDERISNAGSADIPEMMALAHNLEQSSLDKYAQQLYRCVTELDPQHEEAWLDLARTTSNAKDAAAHIRRCLEFHPESQSAQAGMAAAHDRLKAESQKMVRSGRCNAVERSAG